MTIVPRRVHAEAVVAARTDPETLAAAHTAVPVPAELAGWLASLALFTTVPLHHLVPDPAALPPESIRFFSVDPNWIVALVDGACSVGRSGSADLRRDADLAGRLYAAAAPPATMTGFLLRSAVVEGWPGLEVSAWAADGSRLERPLRMERLAPGLLLYLVDRVLGAVEIAEPAEGLHFGLDAGLTSKQLRYVTVPGGVPPDTAVPGAQIPGATAPVHLRDPELRVVDVAATEAAMAAALPDAGTTPFTAAEFALQMVEGAQSVRFTVDPG